MDGLCQDVGIVVTRIVVTGDNDLVLYGGQRSDNACHVFIRGYAEDKMHPAAGKQLCDGCSLLVLQDVPSIFNTKARTFYTRQGFTEIATLKDF